jgi:hypothetical protein
MDQETKTVLSEQDQLRELVGHQGWKVARRIMADKILDLQDAFKIDDRTATAMLNDLRVRKKAAQILFDFLQEIEGTATQAEDNSMMKSNKAHIVFKE